MMRLIIIIFGVLLLIGCRSVDKLTTEIIDNRDSIVIERTLLDTVVITAPDAATLDALWECDSLGNVLMTEINTLQGERLNIRPTIKYVNVPNEKGQIRRKAYFSVLAQVDSLQHVIKVYKEKITRLQRSLEKEQVSKEKDFEFCDNILLITIIVISLVAIFYDVKRKK